MESDYSDFLREAASTCAKMAHDLEILADLFERAFAQFQAFMDWISDVAVEAFDQWPGNFIEQFMDMPESVNAISEESTWKRKNMRPDYHNKCRIRDLHLPNKIMFGRIRRRS